MILVDTSVWIDFFRDGDSWEARRLESAIADHDDLAVCGPIMMEIRQGIASDKAVKEVDRILAPLIYLPTLRRTYRHAADIYRAARAKGRIIRSSMDCVIAACAIENRARLLHRDKDFTAIAEISNLDVVTPD